MLIGAPIFPTKHTNFKWKNLQVKALKGDKANFLQMKKLWLKITQIPPFAMRCHGTVLARTQAFCYWKIWCLGLCTFKRKVQLSFFSSKM